MTKMYLVGANYSLNKGWAAMVLSAVEALRIEIPNIQFTLESFLPEMDSKTYENVEVVETILTSKLRATFLLFRCMLYALFRRMGLNASFLVDSQELKRYIDSDLVLNLGGDPLCQPFQTTSLTFALRRNIAAFAATCYVLLFGILLGKPVVIYAQSVGPFGIFKPMLKLILNRMALISLREKGSVEYLQEMGVKAPIYLTADSAFLLNSKAEVKIPSKDRGPIIGISVSHEAVIHYYKSGKKRFIEMMARVVDYLVENLDATVVFIPHSTGPRDFEDDRLIAKEIHALVRNAAKVVTIDDDYGPNELKGIINQCTLFVGMRMHANIAALSSGVPTIAIAHSYKTYRIMEMLGEEKWVCHIRTLNYEMLASNINNMLKKRDEIATNLRPKVRVAQELASLNAKLVKELLETKLPPAKMIPEQSAMG
jgi:colanic acid/amylovoran biosynthesis protein